jgi:acetyl esterase/lipase
VTNGRDNEQVHGGNLDWRPPSPSTRFPTPVATKVGPVPTHEAYAHRLQAAGVPTVSTRYDGTIHDFGVLNAIADLPTTRAAIRQVADGIRSHIGY